jgi:hypothetical protein
MNIAFFLKETHILNPNGFNLHLSKCFTDYTETLDLAENRFSLFLKTVLDIRCKSILTNSLLRTTETQGRNVRKK